MTTVAIISEYNPFHSGHQFQIDEIRREFGSDTAIVAIMSGNYTQRGDVAFINKGARAKCAVLGGIDLVLELPFPYSSSSAEIFAKSGVKIADSIGIIDYLSFGSESGDIDELKYAAEIISSDEYTAAFHALSNSRSMGYPERCEAAFRAVTNDSQLTFTPNNILAIEYIRAIKSFGSSIKPHTVKRIGAGYSDKNIDTFSHNSAYAIRNAFTNEGKEAFRLFPDTSLEVLEPLYNDGDFPCDLSRISSAIISHLRINPPYDSVTYHDANDGLYNRLYNASFEANNISELLMLSETKNYTRARIKRALINIFFGVTSSDCKTLPAFTQVLGMNGIGMHLLKNSVVADGFKILTKPSNLRGLSDVAMRQKRLSDMADSVFELTKPEPKSGNSALKFTPYIKK